MLIPDVDLGDIDVPAPTPSQPSGVDLRKYPKSVVMSFDYAGARQAGASDREIIDFLSGDIDFDVQGALSAGATESEIAAFLSTDMDDGTTTLGALGEFGKRALGGTVRVPHE